MKYAELLPYIRRFHLGEISKVEMALAIGMWQRAGAML